ncbi:hypothetical protein CHLRE_12g497652v5 [Chlamydomonas reinhardtii]|uniref:Cinnamoyl-CoA reductase n=1 Tax=Chlamydomonas reinhardtii TaxID=3055 RepID=A0A2K3D3I2_CHLRE|nr:uncharacterized protein CHLRE_12g497652v5 [Chlamydomonas reinhardtii]PNW75077.1 hypothetical protein CHLRE_12g497652v5 [Chlamydomonas reinhardtii]QGF19011.1 cinnamoyl-CoA reductase [Chlamydomonas reinhardtii]
MSQLAFQPAYDAEKALQPAKVCVTGVTGFVAGSVVSRLLELGHTVHGTCRDPSRTNTVAHLLSLPGAAERLKLFKADLLSEGSYDEAVSGCDYVIHTASPYTMNVPAAEVQAKLLDPAVKGTEHVLCAASKSPSVKRVVLTSSCAAIYGDPHEFGKDHVYTEADWNPTATKQVLPYYYSKKLAEERAWEMAKAQSQWKLVVINPAVILGPPLSKRTDSESINLINTFLKGKAYPACPHMGFGTVDVRDVAAAHTLAMSHPKAEGRYITVSKSMWFAEMARAIKAGFPDSKFRPPVTTAPKWLLAVIGPAVGLSRDLINYAVGKCPQFNNSKIQSELGFKFHSPEAAIKDQVDAMLALGIAKPF